MRIRRPDHKNAQSILEAAEKDMKFTLSLPVTKESANTIIRNVYECFRMLGEAIMVQKGIESIDHVTPIQELIKIDVNTRRPIRTMDNLRSLRHNINYYGYSPRTEEVNDAIDIAKACFKPLIKKIKENKNDSQTLKK